MRILEITDLHSGSAWSPADPESEVNYEKNVIGLNPLQKDVLNPIWDKLCESEPYDHIVINGDCTDGINYKSNHGEIWCSSMELQAKAAAMLIRRIPLVDKGRISIVGGTPYHIGDNPGADQKVMQYINQMGGRAKYLGIEFVLKAGGCKIHHSHWTSGGFYEGATLNRELVWSYIYKHDIDGLVRGHIHHYHEDSDGSRFAMVLPGWKVADDYVKRKGFRWGRGQVGWVDLILEDGDWDIQPHLFTMKDNFKEVRL